jgi:hypothetical protein
MVVLKNSLLIFATFLIFFILNFFAAFADEGDQQSTGGSIIKNIAPIINLLLSDDKQQPKSITKLIDASLGGSISIQNSRGDLVTLEVPAKALSKPTNITLTCLETPLITPVSSNIFPGVEIEPDGLLLIKPATLRITFADNLSDPAMSRIFLHVSEELAGPISRQTMSDKSIEGQIFHFSPYYGGVPSLEERFALETQLLLRGGADVTFELVYIVDDVFSLYEFVKMHEALGRTDLADEARNGLLGMLEERTLQALDQAVPSTPCGDYRIALYHLIETVREFLNDNTLIQLIQDRIEAVEIDNQCPDVMTGVWRMTPIVQEELCRECLECEWWEEDPFPSWDVVIRQPGGPGSNIITVSDSLNTLNGTWNSNTGELSLSSNPDNCSWLFENSDICGDAIDCRLESCQDTTNISGQTTPSVTDLTAEYEWFYSVTFSYFTAEGSPRGYSTWQCYGSATLNGKRQ